MEKRVESREKRDKRQETRERRLINRFIGFRGDIKWYGMVLIALLMLIGCAQESEPVGTTTDSFESADDDQLLDFLEEPSGTIAYIGTDGNLYTIKSDGSEENQLTRNAVSPDSAEQNSSDTVRIFQQPTWSKTEQKIAYNQFEFERGSQSRQNQIWVTDADGIEKNLVSESEFASIYFNWSPDSSVLGVLNGIPNQNVFQMRIFPMDGEVQVVDVGAPLFFDWSPHSQQIIMHIGTGGSNEKLSLFSLGSGSESEVEMSSINIIEEVFDIEAGGFNTPDWSPDGESLLFARRSIDPNDDDTLIVSRNVSSREDAVIAKYDGEIQVSTSYSPDNEKVAFIPSTGQPYGRLFVADLETKSEVSSESKDVAAYFWSPDGQKIAYLSLYFPPILDDEGNETEDLASSPSGFGLYTLDVASGESTKILEPFSPTPRLGDVLRFYHQYQHSLTFWSPDSQSIVVPVQMEDEAVIVVVSATASTAPRVIADGELAVWSWN